jgi:lipopolysaccharide biosynthesis regulator YciM
MGAALVLLLVALGAMGAGVLIGRYYVPDDRQLRRTARHSRAYMRALSHLIARDHETVMAELRAVVEENVEDTEPYFALGALFRSRGEHERAIRVHQALAVRERDRRKLRHRAMYELGLDFRAAGMPRRATRAMEKVLVEEPSHEGALRALAGLYEEQARFNEAAGMWQRLGRRRGEDLSHREHHLLVAAAQAALGQGDLDSAKQLLKAAQKHEESAHFYAAAAELAGARGNHRGAKERLRQALTADPGLAPHLLPGLIAAEQGLAAQERTGYKRRHDDEFDEEPPPREPAAPQALPAAAAAGSASSGLLLAQAATAGRTDDDDLAQSRLTPPAAMPAASLVPGGPAEPDGAVQARGPGAAGEISAGTADAAHGSGGAVRPGLAAAAQVQPPAVAGALMVPAPGTPTPIDGVSLVPMEPPAATIAERVLAVLAEIEAQVVARSGPRLELALIRAQLMPPVDAAAQAELATALVARFPESLAARVAAARLAIARDDDRAIRGALEGLVSEAGALAWALRGRWQCAHCGNRPGPFSWRCAQCRRWSTLRMETGIEPPPVQPRERRAAPRPERVEGLLGAPPDESLPAATLDAGISDTERATAGVRRSLLGRVGGWFSGVWRRDAP